MEERGIKDYSNKLILAPMVRANTLPFRLICKEYGADIVYSEELIAHKLKNARRVENESVGTIDFLSKEGTPVYRTCELDHPNVVQLGAPEATLALQAAEVVSRDVDGIDINMGCPIHFSVQGGMGSALLSKPQTVKEILSTLKRNLNNSITCKIRLLDTIPKTLDLMRIIEQTGVSAIAIHARYVSERPRDRAHWDQFHEIAQSFSNVPLIINGDVFVHSDIAKVKEATGASSIMIARGAMWNASIFQPEMETTEQVIGRYLKRCFDLDQHYTTSKWNVMQMLQEMKVRNPNEQQINQSKSLHELSKWFQLEDYYLQSRRKLEGV